MNRLNVFNSIIFLSPSCLFQAWHELDTHMYEETQSNMKLWTYKWLIGISDRALFFLALTLHKKKATCAGSHPSHSSLDGRFIFISTGNLWARACFWKHSHRLTRHASTHQPASTGRSSDREVTSLKPSTYSQSPSSISNVAIHGFFKKKEEKSKLVPEITLRHPQKGSRDFLKVILCKSL